MSIGKLSSLTVFMAMAQCVFAADVAEEGGAASVKPDARYLVLLGMTHSTSATLAENIDFVKKGLESGPYGDKWRSGPPDTGHEKITQKDIEAVSKDLSVVLSSKTVADAAGALKNIEAFVDKLHVGCHYTMASTSKMAVLIAASKDAASPSVSSALLKRADKMRPLILAQIHKSNGDYLTKMEDAHNVVEAYMIGLGLTGFSEEALYWLMDSICLNWPGDDLQNKQVNAAKANKSFKLAENGINILLAVDNIRSAKTAGKARTAVAALDKAVKARMALMLSPNGSSRPTPDALAEAKLRCHNAYVELVEYAMEKNDQPAVKPILAAKHAEVKAVLEKSRVKTP